MAWRRNGGCELRNIRTQKLAKTDSVNHSIT